MSVCCQKSREAFERTLQARTLLGIAHALKLSSTVSAAHAVTHVS